MLFCWQLDPIYDVRIHSDNQVAHLSDVCNIGTLSTAAIPWLVAQTMHPRT